MTIETLIARYGLAAIALGAGLEGETAVVTGGVIAHHGLVPVWAAAVAAAVGSFVADQAFFLMGRRFRDHRHVRRVAAKPAFARALAALERHPTSFILAFRFVYGLRTVSPVAIGTSRVPQRTFVILNAIAAVVWAAVFTGVGYVFGHRLERLVGHILSGRWPLLAAGIVVVVIALGLGWWLRRPRMPNRPSA